VSTDGAESNLDALETHLGEPNDDEHPAADLVEASVTAGAPIDAAREHSHRVPSGYHPMHGPHASRNRKDGREAPGIRTKEAFWHDVKRGRHYTKRFLAAAAGALACISSRAHASGPEEARPTRPIVVSSGFQGAFVSPKCVEGGADFEGGIGRLASANRSVTGGLVLDAGDLFGASAIAHLLSSPERVALAAATIANLGYRAVAIGHRDLAAPRADLVARSAALAAAKVPVVLSNLRCDASATEVCAVVHDADDPPFIVRDPALPGRSVAVVVVVSPGNLTAVSRDSAVGLKLEEPLEILARTTLQARAAGASEVIAIVDPSSADALQETLKIAHGLPREGRPDVLIVNRVSADLADLRSARDGLRAYATEPSDVITVDLDAPDRPARIPPRNAAKFDDTEVALVRVLREDLCNLDHSNLPGAALERPMDREALTALLLDVLRETTESDVSIINRGAVRPIPGFPLRDRIGRLDVLAAIPFDDRLEVGEMTGDELRSFVERDTEGRFRQRGVSRDGKEWLVNGRTLIAEQRYRVVTTGFVLDGAHGGLGGGASFGTRPGGGPRDVFLAWLEQARSGDARDAAVDPARRTRWLFRAFLDSSWAQSAIRNDQNFQDPQLARSSATAILFDGELRADADHPDYTLDDNLRLRLGFSQTADANGVDSGLQKSADLIALRTQLTWRGAYSERRWFHPVPFVESYLESEFARPDNASATRAFHHLQYRPALGARFELFRRSNLNFGVGVDRELFDATSRFAPAFIARAELPPQSVLELRGRDIEGQIFSEVTWRDPGATLDGAVIRTTARVSIPVFDPFSIAFSYDLFARRLGASPWAVAHDTNVGLQFDVTRALQAYRY
jgi:hypothetical protein